MTNQEINIAIAESDRWKDLTIYANENDQVDGFDSTGK
jgi:hypothetical protein